MKREALVPKARVKMMFWTKMEMTATEAICIAVSFTRTKKLFMAVILLFRDRAAQEVPKLLKPCR